MTVRIIMLCMVFFLISGCSIFLNSTSQKIYVTTPGTTGAYCVLETEKHRYQLVTPAAVHVERTAYDIVATCNKEGYKTGYTTVKATAAARPLWDGMEPYTPGISTDTVTRPVYSYPKTIRIPLSIKD